MSQFARVESLDVLRELKVALVKFRDAAGGALIDAESDLQRSLNWVQSEQRTYWQGQYQKRQQTLLEAREALRQKLMFRSALQSRDAAIEERKAVAVAQRALEQAESKIKLTRAWGVKLNQESIIYRGMAQRMANQVEIRLPVAVEELQKVIENLESYLALEASPPTPSAMTAGAGSDQSEAVAGMSRGVGMAPADSALPDTATAPLPTPAAQTPGDSSRQPPPPSGARR
jgi:hypothetical protein